MRSGTVTTVALAKKSTVDRRPHTYAGAILMASGVMYLRLALLVSIFNQGLARELVLPFGILAIEGDLCHQFWRSPNWTAELLSAACACLVGINTAFVSFSLISLNPPSSKTGNSCK